MLSDAIKQEPIENDSTEELGSLYKDHIVKEEIVIGPEMIQASYSNLQLKSEDKGDTKFCLKKEEHTDTTSNKQNLHKSLLHKCEECFKNFSTKQTLNHHRKTHTDINKYWCDICGKGFKIKKYLKVHTLIHLNKNTNKRLYTCKMCSKSYNRDSSLSRHRQTHTNINKYWCDICGKNFKLKRYLKEHILNTHKCKTLHMQRVPKKLLKSLCIKNTHANTH